MKNILSSEDTGEEVAGKVGGEEEEVEVEEGEDINQIKDQVPTISALAQIPTIEPILMLSSTSKAVDDLGFPIVTHSFNRTLLQLR